MARGDEPGYTLGTPVTDASGVQSYPLRSPHQPGENPLRVLLPDRQPGGATPPRPLFVLSVEAGLGTTWGDGLDEVRRCGLHNKYGLTAVAPAFSQLPWYADHPTDSEIRQESYMVRSVVPAVDALLPGSHMQRLLLGFSKSGWGALSLLTRYPELFAAAAVWDAPLMKEQPDQFGMGPIFGTQENFDCHCLPARLAEGAGPLRARKRVALLGYDGFRDHMQRAHELLDELQIPHEFADGPWRRHHWESGWVEEAVAALVRLVPGP